MNLVTFDALVDIAFDMDVKDGPWAEHKWEGAWFLDLVARKFNIPFDEDKFIERVIAFQESERDAKVLTDMGR